jgi:membrane protease YdiL (CAAX protease family)
MVRNTIIDLVNFLKYPKDYQLSFTIGEKVKFLFVLLLFEIVFLFVVIFPIHLGVDQITILKEPKVDYSISFLMSILVFVIIMPLVEELVFRYFLRYKGFKTRFISRKDGIEYSLFWSIYYQ